MNLFDRKEIAKRRNYSKPQLFTYGSVQELTTGGSGKNSEAASAGCKDRLTQKVNPSCK